MVILAENKPEKRIREVEKQDILDAVQKLKDAHYLDVTLSTLNMGMHHSAVDVKADSYGMQVKAQGKPVLFIAFVYVIKVNTIGAQQIQFQMRSGERVSNLKDDLSPPWDWYNGYSIETKRPIDDWGTGAFTVEWDASGSGDDEYIVRTTKIEITAVYN